MNILEVKLRIRALDSVSSSRFVLMRDMDLLRDEQKAEYQERLCNHLFEHIAALTEAVKE